MDTVSTSKLCCLLTFEGKEGRMKKEEEEFALVFHGGGDDRELFLCEENTMQRMSRIVIFITILKLMYFVTLTE